MGYLFLSIAASVSIYVLFKLFGRYGVNTFPAIVINYWVAVIVGAIKIGDAELPALSDLQWLPHSIVEGVLFIALFNVMALTVQKHSITVASVASRTAMVIPAVVFMFILPTSQFSVYTLVGVAIACVGVYLSSKKDKSIEIDSRYIWLPIVLFVGSGIIDLIIGYVESQLIRSEIETLLFVPSIFLVAACIGSLILAYQLVRGKMAVGFKDVIGGLVLGTVNYCSILFVLRAMGEELVDEASFFPINNMGIVIMGTLVGLVVFKERLTKANWAGILCGILAIAILLLA